MFGARTSVHASNFHIFREWKWLEAFQIDIINHVMVRDRFTVGSDEIVWDMDCK